jgi:hypothetical protein
MRHGSGLHRARLGKSNDDLKADLPEPDVRHPERHLRSSVFGVTIVAENQGPIASAFARKGTDKLSGIGVVRGRTGVPSRAG